MTPETRYGAQRNWSRRLESAELFKGEAKVCGRCFVYAVRRLLLLLLLRRWCTRLGPTRRAPFYFCPQIFAVGRDQTTRKSWSEIRSGAVRRTRGVCDGKKKKKVYAHPV